MKNFILSVVVSIICLSMSSFVIFRLWGWFIVPIFELEAIRFVEAIGLAIILYYVLARMDDVSDYEEYTQKLLSIFVFNSLLSLFTLLIGWAVTLFL